MLKKLFNKVLRYYKLIIMSILRMFVRIRDRAMERRRHKVQYMNLEGTLNAIAKRAIEEGNVMTMAELERLCNGNDDPNDPDPMAILIMIED